MGGTPIIQYNQGDDGSTKSPSPPGPKIILDMVYYEPLYSGLGKCPMGILNITFRGLYRANSVVVNWSYPLVNVYVTNWKDPPFSSWVNPLFLWPLSIAMLNYQRVYKVINVENYDVLVLLLLETRVKLSEHLCNIKTGDLKSYRK